MAECVDSDGLTAEDKTSRDDYLMAGGFRHVAPYLHVYNSSAGGQWAGRTVLSAFCTFFTAYSESYFRSALERGWLTVNGARARPEGVIAVGDKLAHLVHRHEPPVLDAPLLWHQVGDIIVINKPASWPMYPTGAYRKNSLLHILSAEHGLRPPHLLYRLDRLTSGLVLLATTPAACRSFLRGFKAGHVSKVYLARVMGRMDESAVTRAAQGEGGQDPDVVVTPCTGSTSGLTSWREALVSTWPGLFLQRWLEDEVTPHLADWTDGEGQWEAIPPCEVRVTHPIRPQPGKRGRFESGRHVRASGEGKESESRFYPVAYDPVSNTTLVLAQAVTGRTHQLRVHLQGLGSGPEGGFPIANDPVYGLAGREGHAAYASWLACATDPRDSVPIQAHPDAMPVLADRLAEQPLAGCTASPEQLVAMASPPHEDDTYVPPSARDDTYVPPSAREVAAQVVAACPWCGGRQAPSETDSLDDPDSPGEVEAGSIGDGTPAPARHSVGFRSCIWLHATSYGSESVTYAVGPPMWARQALAASFK